MALQVHIAESLVNDEFDMTVFQEKPIDHGCASPLPLLWPHQPDWPGTVVPIAVNVLQFPLRTARRCWRLGQAVRPGLEEDQPRGLRSVSRREFRGLHEDAARARRALSRRG